MRTRLLLTLSLAAGAPVLPAQESDPAPSRQVALDSRQRIQRVLQKHLAAARKGELGEIRVGDATLSPAVVRREVVYVAGQRVVELRLQRYLIDHWKAALIAEGHKPQEFEVEDGGEPAEPPGLVRRAERQEREFDKVFLEGPPAKWPEISKQAIIASAEGDSGEKFWDNMVKATKAGGLPPFWMKLCRAWVGKYLIRNSGARYPSDGLPDDVALRVDDFDWKTADAFAAVADDVQPQDLERALTTVVLREVLRQELVAKGCWLGDDEFSAAFAKYAEPYDKTPFTVEIIATAFKGFPGLEAYRHHWRLLHSYERMIADELDSERLAAYAQKRVDVFGEGKVDVELAPFLARDPADKKWRPDGFAAAQRAAIAAYQRLESGVDFSLIRGERESLGELGQDAPEPGLLDGQTRNQLRQVLHEGEFTDLLTGFSLADHLFFEAPVGKVVGPLPGPEGYYLAVVRGRRPPMHPPMMGEDGVKLVREGYLNERFSDWANDVLTRAVIR